MNARWMFGASASAALLLLACAFASSAGAYTCTSTTNIGSSCPTINTGGTDSLDLACYNLTQDLCPNGDCTGDCITITKSFVAINMQGHNIGGGTGSAINGSTVSYVTVNGPGMIGIVNLSWGNPGIALGPNATVQNVTVINSGASFSSSATGGEGISVGANSTVTGCIVAGNGPSANSNNISAISCDSGVGGGTGGCTASGGCASGCVFSLNVVDGNTGNGIGFGGNPSGSQVNCRVSSDSTAYNICSNSVAYNLADGLLDPESGSSASHFDENALYSNSSLCAYSQQNGSTFNNLCNGSSGF